MKKILFILSVLTICALSSCGGFQSEVNPLLGNESLNTFTTLADDGTTILTGVTNPQSGHVLVSPAEFNAITGDNDVIICRSPKEKFYVYKTNGEQIGVFDLFTHWRDNGNYYLGSKYGLQVFYFPANDEIVSTKQTFSEIDVMLLLVDGKWQIRDYFGKLLWTIPKDFMLIRDIQRQDVFVIAIEEGRSHVLYDKDGKKLKKLTSSKWKKLQSQFENMEVTENGATAASVETLAPYL